MAFCSASHVMVVLYTVCQRSKQVKIWWCEVRTVWWVYQNYSSKFSDGCGGVHIVVSWHCLGGATFQVFFLLEKLENGRHWDFVAVRVPLLSPEAISAQKHLSYNSIQ